MITASVDLLQQSVAEIPRGGADYTTNLYADRNKLERWSRQGPLHIETTTNGTILILREDRGFKHVYHVAQSCETLVLALTKLPPDRYVADLVGKGDELDKVCAAYATAGFTNHASLRRMTRVSYTDVGNIGSSKSVAEQAHPDAVPAVAAFLERLLDPLTDQIPDIGELMDAAQDGRLLAKDHDGALAGVLMYDRKDKVVHLRYWYVAPTAWGVGVGRALMASFMASCVHSPRIVLWVIGSNDRSIAIYRHYGFATDGLLDHVMTLHKE